MSQGGAGDGVMGARGDTRPKGVNHRASPALVATVPAPYSTTCRGIGIIRAPLSSTTAQGGRGRGIGRAPRRPYWGAGR
jgi:hypothetical protein